jgi:D-sedoheptulose 7-phosphate isomerase
VNSFLETYLKNLQRALDGVDLSALEEAIQWLEAARAHGRQIFVCGNGGSASTSSHFVTDLGKGASYGRPQRFRIMALTDSISTITAYANDVDYEWAFVEQLKNFAQEGDLLLAISSSGNSPNVLRAVEYANAAGCRTIALTGGNGGKLGPMAQLDLRVNELHTGRIEDAHMAICHMISYFFIDNSNPPCFDRLADGTFAAS